MTQDLSTLTDEERLEYWRRQGALELAFLRQHGNFVGEKPDPRYTVNDYSHDHEAAYQFRIAEEARLAAEVFA